jgi:hypothetical protein
LVHNARGNAGYYVPHVVMPAGWVVNRIFAAARRSAFQRRELINRARVIEQAD